MFLDQDQPRQLSDFQVIVWEAPKWQCEVAGHLKPPRRKQRDEHAGALLAFSFSPGPEPHGMDHLRSWWVFLLSETFGNVLTDMPGLRAVPPR